MRGEKKTQGLFSVISIARSCVDTLTDPNGDIRATFAVDYEESAYRLDELVPMVVAYASPDCRAELDDLRSLLRDGNIDVIAASGVEKARKEKLAAIDAQDFEAAAAARDQEREPEAATPPAARGRPPSVRTFPLPVKTVDWREQSIHIRAVHAR